MRVLFVHGMGRTPISGWPLLLLLLGGLMALMGTWRARRGQALLRIDQFVYGYLFALAFAVLRFRFAN